MKNLKNIQESDKTFSWKRQQQSRKGEQNLKLFRTFLFQL